VDQPAVPEPEALPAGRPSVTMAVVMRRVALTNRWQPWKWELDAVLPDLGEFGTAPKRLDADEHGEHWAHPGYAVTLYRDEGEGYYLNLTSTAPCWFVLWRMAEEPDEDGETRPVPVTVSLSYNEAGRWLDAARTSRTCRWSRSNARGSRRSRTSTIGPNPRSGAGRNLSRSPKNVRAIEGLR